MRRITYYMPRNPHARKIVACGKRGKVWITNTAAPAEKGRLIYLIYIDPDRVVGEKG